MAQAVIRRPVTTETRVRAGVSPFGICNGESGTGTVFSVCYSVFLVHIILPWPFMLIYQLRGEQQACSWPQFRDIVSRHRHEHEQPNNIWQKLQIMKLH
jgi:hypothetical protein